MEELIDKVLKVILSLPDPVNLVDVIEKIQESDNTLELDAAKKLLINNYLNKQPEKKGISIDHVILRSVSPCPECGGEINNGYFKIILASRSDSANSDANQVEQQLVISYEALHNLMNHEISSEFLVATNESFGELEQQNLNKNPRDQLSQQKLEKSIENYTLKELNAKLSEMMAK